MCGVRCAAGLVELVQLVLVFLDGAEDTDTSGKKNLACVLFMTA